MARVQRQTLAELSAYPPLTERWVRGRAPRYLCHFLKVFVPFLEGPRSVEGLSHTCVLAEEGLAVVLDPVQHLRAKVTKNMTTRGGETAATGRRRTAKYGGAAQVRDGGEASKGEGQKTACVTARRAFSLSLPATSSFKGLNERTASAWTYDLVR